MTPRHYWFWFGCGALLRLLYPVDIAWGRDQEWTLSHAVTDWNLTNWPWLGMESSTGLANPGLSLWIFKPLVLLGLTTPITLSQGVVWVNLLTLAGLGAWAIWRYSEEPVERDTWLFAGAMVAVNPLYVFLSRTVWAQAMAPPIALLLWIGFLHRRKPWGSILWGLASAALGQVHMVGFALALAVWLCAARNRSLGAWKFFWAGAALSAWPLWFWLRAVPAGQSVPAYSLLQRLPGRVWAWWLASESGWGVRYLDTNFWGVPFKEFLAWPLLGSYPTYGMLLCLAGLTALLAWPFLVWLKNFLSAPSQPARWMPLCFSELSDTAILLRSAVFYFGILATLTPTVVFAHYFITLFPAGSLWISRMWLLNHPQTGRRALWLMLALQFALSLVTAFFVHHHFYDAASGVTRFPLVTPP